MLAKLCKTFIGGFLNSKTLGKSLLLSFFFITGGTLLVPSHASAFDLYNNNPSDGVPTGSWVSGGGMLSADQLFSSAPAPSAGSVNYIDWTLYTWFGSGDMDILCKVNGSVISSATIPRSDLNQTFSGSLPPYGGHSYIWARLQLTSIPWSGSGCNFNSGDSVELDEWNGSGHSFVAPYDASSMAIGQFGTTPPAPPGDLCTTGADGVSCIDSVTPPDDPSGSNALATSTSFAFGSTGYIQSSDYVSGTSVHITATNNEVESLGVGVVPYNYFDETFPISASGAYTVSTTSDVERTGNFTLNTTITKPWFSVFGLFNVGSQTIVSTTTQFVVATSSVLDILGTQVSFAQGSATTYASASTTDTCNLNLGSLDNNWVASCGRYLFYPQTICQYVTGTNTVIAGSCRTFGQIAYDTSQGFLTRQPWGYATLLYQDIASTTGTSTLPALAFTFPAGQGLPSTVSGHTLDLTPWSLMAGPGSIIATKTVPESGHNFLNEFLGYWNFLWELMFALYVLNEFYGAWKAGDFAFGGFTSSGMDRGITAYRGLVANRQKKQYRDLKRVQDHINRNS